LRICISIFDLFTTTLRFTASLQGTVAPIEQKNDKFFVVSKYAVQSI